MHRSLWRTLRPTNHPHHSATDPHTTESQLQDSLSSSDHLHSSHLNASEAEPKFSDPMHLLTPLQTAPDARHGHKMVQVRNRYLIMFGGALSDCSFDSKVYVYDTLNSEWYTPNTFSNSNLPGLSAFGMASDEERYVFIAGGIDSENEINKNLIIIDTHDWSRCSIPILSDDGIFCSFGCSLSYYDGQLIYFGGIISERFAMDEMMTQSNHTFVLDVATIIKSNFILQNKWKKIKFYGPLPPESESHSAVVYNSDLYIFGGTCFQRLSTAWKLDLKKWSWKNLGKFTLNDEGLSMHTSCLVGNEIYHWGGWSTKSIQAPTKTNDVASILSANLFFNTIENGVIVAHSSSNLENSFGCANHAMCAIGSRLFTFGGRVEIRDENSINSANQLSLSNEFSYLDINPPSEKISFEYVSVSSNAIDILFKPQADTTYNIALMLKNFDSDIDLHGIPAACAVKNENFKAHQLTLDKYFDNTTKKMNPIEPKTEYVLFVLPVNRSGSGVYQTFKIQTPPVSKSAIKIFDLNFKFNNNLEIYWKSFNHANSNVLYLLPSNSEKADQKNTKTFHVNKESSTSLNAEIDFETILEYANKTQLGYVLFLKLESLNSSIATPSVSFINLHLY